jgi:hypothetical protein
MDKYRGFAHGDIMDIYDPDVNEVTKHVLVEIDLEGRSIVVLNDNGDYIKFPFGHEV